MAASLLVRFNAGTCPHLMRLSLPKGKQLQTASYYCLTVNEGSCHVGNDLSSSRFFSTSHSNYRETKGSEKSITKVTDADGDVSENYRERFIPMTRLSIIRYLIEEKDFLNENEKQIFPNFARSLDRSVMNQCQGLLGELKYLFDPINPDKDTVQTREFSRREKLDNEFWLLQQLEDVMTKANFHELPKPKVEDYLKEHVTNGVRVSVNWNRYDVLRFWVLGHEQPKVSLSLGERISNLILRRPPREPMQYYKRVIVAIRLKKDSKLILKAFKEVPVQSLEMLLPDGTVKMSTMDKGVMMTSVSIAGVGILAKVVTNLAKLHVDWTLLVASVTGLIGFRAWSMYKNRRNEYLIKVTQMLYYKNIANNLSLLASLVDRAEDESFKEALLTYAFLLTSRPAVYRDRPSAIMTAQQSGGLTVEELSEQVEDWLEKHTGSKLQFDCSDAIPFLMDLGLVTKKNDKLNVVMLDVAKKMLPPVPLPQSLQSSRDAGIMDDFDRSPFLETEEEYKANDKKTSKYGWF